MGRKRSHEVTRGSRVALRAPLIGRCYLTYSLLHHLDEFFSLHFAPSVKSPQKPWSYGQGFASSIREPAHVQISIGLAIFGILFGVSPSSREAIFYRCQQSLHPMRVTRRLSDIGVAWTSHITYRQKSRHIQRASQTPFQWNTNHKSLSQRIVYLYSYYLITGDRIYQVSLAWRKHLSFLTLNASSCTLPTQVNPQLTDSKTIWMWSLDEGLHDEPLSWNRTKSRRKFMQQKMEIPYQKSGAWQVSDDTRHLSVDSSAYEHLTGDPLSVKDL